MDEFLRNFGATECIRSNLSDCRGLNRDVSAGASDTFVISRHLLVISEELHSWQVLLDNNIIDPNQVEFIIGSSFGEEVEKSLKEIAANIGAEGKIFYQEEALGTAHAILCAQECLNEKVIVAFADTLFKADFKLDSEKDGVIWVQRIDDPSAFGVVKLNEENEITDFVEKPADKSEDEKDKQEVDSEDDINAEEFSTFGKQKKHQQSFCHHEKNIVFIEERKILVIPTTTSSASSNNATPSSSYKTTDI